MESQKNRFIFSSALLFCAVSAQAATLTVPGQYGTIQAAITVAKPGDVVMLASGTYTGAGNVNLDFGGKNITVASQNGAATTIIDCQQQSGTEGVSFHSGETSAAKLLGITIANGNHPRGGGVSITGSSPTLSGCVFSGNFGAGGGGGIYADGTSHPTISGCVFTHNTTSGSGGGLYAGTQIALTGCTFTENTASNSGAGACLFNTTGTANSVSGCTFNGNFASADGGGVYDGANIDSFVNCAFVGNLAANGGGLEGNVALTNCTFTGNYAATTGGAVSDVRTVTNCILFGDNYNGTGGAEIGSSIRTPSVTYSDVQGAYVGMGNIAADPQFARTPSNLLGEPAGATADYGDLHLRMSSRLLRSGTSVTAPLTDVTGAARPVPPSIGAYETGPTLLPALADSDVLSSIPTQNYGSDPTLIVGGFLGTAYLKFDMTALSPLSASSTVKLHVSAGRAQPGTASLSVAATTSSWNELGITFSNRPALGLPQGFLNITGGSGNAPYDVDITPYVKAQQALGASQIGLALTQFTFGSPVSIDSKENAAGDGPQLVINY